MQILQDKYPNGVDLIHVDYRDSLDGHPELIQAIIDKDHEALDEVVRDWYHDSKSYDYYLKEANIPEEDHDEARERLDENDTSNPINDLIRNTSKINMRIEMYSNYDCGYSHHLHGGEYTYEETFFGSAIKGLGINPKEIKRMLVSSGNKCHGLRPKRKDRGHIDYNEFLDEHEETTAGRVPCFAVSVDLMDIYEHKGTIKEIIVQPGTPFGLMNSRVGTCSCFDATLKKEMKIKLDQQTNNDRAISRSLLSDEDGYGIDAICGMTDSFRNKGSFTISK